MKRVSFSILCLMIVALFVVNPIYAEEQGPVFDAPGFDPNRETYASMPDEHIDPFTGGLILSHEDARLPGNGGLDLVIQRTFNSKNTCKVASTSRHK